MSDLRLDHPDQDIRIGLARAACAEFVIACFPDQTQQQHAEHLLLLLEMLGLLPKQNPDRMISVAMSTNREMGGRAMRTGSGFH